MDGGKGLRVVQEGGDLGREVASQGQRILFVGTKRQAQEAVAEEAKRCGEFSVTNRWLGGTLTNFVTLRTSIERLKDIEARLQHENSPLTKKDRLRLARDHERVSRNLEGIRCLVHLPAPLFVLDPTQEY